MINQRMMKAIRILKTALNVSDAKAEDLINAIANVVLERIEPEFSADDRGDILDLLEEHYGERVAVASEPKLTPEIKATKKVSKKGATKK